MYRYPGGLRPLSSTLCSCGEATRHLVARRTTADGFTVRFFSDGTVVARFRVLASRLTAAALWLLADTVALYDASELAALVRETRASLGQRTFNPLTYLRRRMQGLRVVSLKKGRTVEWRPA